jgi:hypothetical protein
MGIDIFSLQPSRVTPNSWREWRYGRRWEKEKRSRLVRHVVGH